MLGSLGGMVDELDVCVCVRVRCVRVSVCMVVCAYTSVCVGEFQGGHNQGLSRFPVTTCRMYVCVCACVRMCERGV